MGCNCGGSMARSKTEPRKFQPTVQERSTSPFRERRTGGPGEPGYYFTGPRKPKPAAS
jgi:hypothetical protein